VGWLDRFRSSQRSGGDLLDDGALQDYLRRLDQAVRAHSSTDVRRAYDRARKTAPNDPEVPLSAGEAWLDLGYLPEAEAALAEAVRLMPDSALARALHASALVEMARLDDADDEVQNALRLDPRCPEAVFYSAVVEDIRGRYRRADRLYDRAQALAGPGMFAPRRLGRTAFDRVVRAAIADLPDRVRSYLSNVLISVRDMPRLEDVVERGLNPLLLGLFEGTSRAEQSISDPWSVLPSNIYLFQRNLERSCPNRQELREQIRITLLHEVGHFLGLTEEDLHDRGLG